MYKHGRCDGDGDEYDKYGDMAMPSGRPVTVSRAAVDARDAKVAAAAEAEGVFAV